MSDPCHTFLEVHGTDSLQGTLLLFHIDSLTPLREVIDIIAARLAALPLQGRVHLWWGERLLRREDTPLRLGMPVGPESPVHLLLSTDDKNKLLADVHRYGRYAMSPSSPLSRTPSAPSAPDPSYPRLESMPIQTHTDEVVPFSPPPLMSPATSDSVNEDAEDAEKLAEESLPSPATTPRTPWWRVQSPASHSRSPSPTAAAPEVVLRQRTPSCEPAKSGPEEDHVAIPQQCETCPLRSTQDTIRSPTAGMNHYTTVRRRGDIQDALTIASPNLSLQCRRRRHQCRYHREPTYDEVLRVHLEQMQHLYEQRKYL